jgi:tRNA(Ile)-lysidine synthase
LRLGKEISSPFQKRRGFTCLHSKQVNPLLFWGGYEILNYNHEMESTHLQKKLQEVCLLSPDLPILVGVSGGADSLCLLDSLHRLGYPLWVAHFDHGLRPESAEDARTVAKIAQEMGLKVIVGSEDVRAMAAEAGLSLEEAARKARYRFLFEQARICQAQAVAVAHTANDQVETVLMHLLRGAGLNGLKGMSARAILPEWDPQIPLVRPLLEVWREETEAWCAAYQLTPLHDPTNWDTTFFRNRLRHELIPYLQSYNPNVKEVIWRMAQVLGGDWEVLAGEVERAWQRCWLEDGAHWSVLCLAHVQDLPEGLQRAVLRRAIDRLRPGLRDIDFALIERALHWLCEPPSGHWLELAAGLQLWMEAGRLYVTETHQLPQEWPQIGSEEALLAVPGEVSLEHGWVLRAERRPRCGNPPGGQVVMVGGGAVRLELGVELNPQALVLPLIVRTMRPGERLNPLGMGGHRVKLSDFFVNRKLPQRARAGWPLVISGSEVAWVAGLHMGEKFKVSAMDLETIHLKLVKG